MSHAATAPVRWGLTPLTLGCDYLNPWGYERNERGALVNSRPLTGLLPGFQREFLATPVFVTLSVPFSLLTYYVVRPIVYCFKEPPAEESAGG